MTDTDNATHWPESPLLETKRDLGGRGPRRWAAPAVLAGALACGIALGFGAYAATASTETAGWRQGVRLAFVQHMIGRALDSVGASAEQENKVHDIVVARFAEIAPDPEEHAALRKHALELLAAPTIDRAEVEKVRAQAVATFDAKSKAVVGGLLDIADQLTPDQRAKLAAQIEAMPAHGPMMMGPWGGGRHGGPMFGAPPEGGAD
jgi:Spy/CpxP family protein refolding chaperone